MATELRISITLPLPDDAFGQAAILGKVQPVLDQALATLTEAVGIRPAHRVDVVRLKARPAAVAAIVSVEPVQSGEAA